MKTYTYEELQEFITSVLNRPCSGKLVYCFSRRGSDKNLHAFIIVEENMRLELPWHDGPQYLSPGDYLHASRNDIYGISAAVLKTATWKRRLRKSSPEALEIPHCRKLSLELAQNAPSVHLPFLSGRFFLKRLFLCILVFLPFLSLALHFQPIPRPFPSTFQPYPHRFYTLSSLFPFPPISARRQPFLICRVIFYIYQNHQNIIDKILDN